MLSSEDGVDVLETDVPLEAYVDTTRPGVVASISSTSLIYMGAKLGWEARLLETRETRNLLSDKGLIGHIRQLGADLVKKENLDSEQMPAPAGTGQQTEIGDNVLFGVPVFSYENFGPLQKTWEEEGSFDVNIGDYFQTLAVRLALLRSGVAPQNIRAIDRDNLAHYAGPPVNMVMNGVFYDHCFPISDRIKPIFIGIHLTKQVAEKHQAYFKQLEPIGCRDTHTCQIFEELGIDAPVTGCMTTTLPRGKLHETRKDILVIYGTGSGELPEGLLSAMPRELLDRAKFIYHRVPVFEYPVTPPKRSELLRYTRHLWNMYRTTAALVITPLHHAATPCISAGIPVVLARHDKNMRFSHLRELMPVYSPDTFAEIDWNPKPLNIDLQRKALNKLIARKVAERREAVNA